MVADGFSRLDGKWLKQGRAPVIRIGMEARLNNTHTDLLEQFGNQLGTGGFTGQTSKVGQDEAARLRSAGSMGEYDILLVEVSAGLVEDPARLPLNTLIESYVADPSVRSLNEAFLFAPSQSRRVPLYKQLTDANPTAEALTATWSADGVSACEGFRCLSPGGFGAT